MKPLQLLGRSLTVTPLVLGLALGSTGVAVAITPASVTAHAGVTRQAAAHPAAKHGTKHAARHTARHHAKHVVKHTRSRKHHTVTVHPATPAGASTTSTGAATTPVSASQAVALTPFEARLVVLVNQARAAAGVPALTVVAGATDVARRWSVRLANDDALSHNPDIASDLQAAGSPNWTFIAENVGSTEAGDANGLFAAYMASPHHRENILDPRAVEIGMGAVTTSEPEGDTTFNTMDFVNSYQASYGNTKTNAVAAELPLADLATAVS